MQRIGAAIASAAAGAAMIAATAATPAQSAEMRPIITYDAAKSMIEACVSLADASGWRMHIAIMNNTGDLVAYMRMDDSIYLSKEISIAKARTSASFPGPSEAFAGLAFGENGPTPFAFLPNDIVFFAGGLPIMSGEAHIGGIGVSGAQADEDKACAQAGLDAAAAAGHI